MKWMSSVQTKESNSFFRHFWLWTYFLRSRKCWHAYSITSRTTIEQSLKNAYIRNCDVLLLLKYIVQTVSRHVWNHAECFLKYIQCLHLYQWNNFRTVDRFPQNLILGNLYRGEYKKFITLSWVEITIFGLLFTVEKGLYYRL